MALDSLQLSTFAAVIHEGSFEAAARALHITSSAVSQRIKALEQSVGQVLVCRSKPCRATEAGQPLLRLAGQLAVLEREALDAARGSAGEDAHRTRIPIVVNADSMASWFLPALTALPPALSLCFDLHSDDQDHTADLLRDGTVMAAVTAQHQPVQGCRVERLGSMRYLAVAAPDLAGRHFTDRAGADGLTAAPMMLFDRKDRLQHRFLRTLTRREVDPPVHYVPSVSGFNQAIRLGLGWGMVPEQLAQADLAAGHYVELAPGRHLDVPLYWQHWRLDSAPLQALTAAVKAAATTSLR